MSFIFFLISDSLISGLVILQLEVIYSPKRRPNGSLSVALAGSMQRERRPSQASNYGSIGKHRRPSQHGLNVGLGAAHKERRASIAKSQRERRASKQLHSAPAISTQLPAASQQTTNYLQLPVRIKRCIQKMRLLQVNQFYFMHP